MDNVYNNINNINYYKPNRNCKILIVFDDMIPDMKTNKKLQFIVTELFIRCRKLHISLVIIIQSFFLVPKNVILNSTHNLLMSQRQSYGYELGLKIEFPNFTLNHSSDIDYQDFLKIYRNFTAKQYLFLVINTTLSSDNLLIFRCNILQEF